MIRVAIVGGGFSGILVARHLLHALSPEARKQIEVIIFEREQDCGVAYSSPDSAHLLNVVAGKMSAFEEDPGHFVRFLESIIPGGSLSGRFATRRIYRDYLLSIAHGVHIEFPSNLRVIRDSILSAERRGSNLLLKTSSEQLEVEHLVLAYGNLHTAEAPSLGKMAVALSAWPLPVQEFSKSSFLLVGCGLTMVDVALSIARTNPSAKIYAISRRAVLPHAHEGKVPSEDLKATLAKEISYCSSVRGILQIVRKYAEQNHWQEVIDALRPITLNSWYRLSLEEKRRFMRHLNTLWSIHRHRMSPEVAGQINELLSREQLELIKGRIMRLQPLDGSILVSVVSQSIEKCIEVSAVINCTGPASIRQLQRAEPLLRSLLENQLVEADDLGIGLSVKSSSAPEILHTELISALGPPLRGELLECTAVPDLRKHAQRLGELLAKKVSGSSSVCRTD